MSIVNTFFLESYYYFVAFHLIFIVSWFAGLFYNLRLFVYWTEAQSEDEVKKGILTEQYTIMSRRLWQIITLPASVLVFFFGLMMILKWYPHFNLPAWLIFKLSMVIFLYGFQQYFYELHKKMKDGVFRWSSFQLRLWNEVPTIFLFCIVFLAILKPKSTFTYIIGLVILVFIGLTMLYFSFRYKNKRKNIQKYNDDT